MYDGRHCRALAELVLRIHLADLDVYFIMVTKQNLKQWNKAKLWRHIQSWNLHKNIKKMKSRYSEKKNLNFFTLKVMAGTYKYCNIFLCIFVQRDRMSLIIMERSHNKWRHVLGNVALSFFARSIYLRFPIVC